MHHPRPTRKIDSAQRAHHSTNTDVCASPFGHPYASPPPRARAASPLYQQQQQQQHVSKVMPGTGDPFLPPRNAVANPFSATGPGNGATCIADVQQPPRGVPQWNPCGTKGVACDAVPTQIHLMTRDVLVRGELSEVVGCGMKW